MNSEETFLCKSWLEMQRVGRPLQTFPFQNVALGKKKDVTDSLASPKP